MFASSSSYVCNPVSLVYVKFYKFGTFIFILGEQTTSRLNLNILSDAPFAFTVKTI